MASGRSSAMADGDEREALCRVYALVKRSVADRIVVDAEIERRLATIVLLTYCAEQRLSPATSYADEISVARRCVEGLLAKTTTVSSHD